MRLDRTRDWIQLLGAIVALIVALIGLYNFIATPDDSSEGDGPIVPLSQSQNKSNEQPDTDSTLMFR